MSEKTYYQESIEQLFQLFDSSEKGLSDEQAKRTLEANGYNELKAKEQTPTWKLFLETFKDVMVIVLLIVAVIQMILGSTIESIVIFAVLIINSIVSVIQTKKAEDSLDALKKLSSPSAKVLRNNQATMIPAREVVVGDIVLLDAGDFVPADGRLLEEGSLKIDEGMLTGESVPAEKKVTALHQTAQVGDRINMVFSGTLVVYGRGKFLVTNTGTTTEIGKVADLLNNATSSGTPLQRNLDRFSKKLGIAILLLSVMIFGIQTARIFIEGSSDIWPSVINAFMFAVAVAVAAIPEALQSIVTIVLSLGTSRMAKEHAIIRKLSAVETLGSTSIICTDKTGTLTQNKMTVVKSHLFSEEIMPDKESLTEDKRLLLNAAILANDASFNEAGKKIGDPTEIALIDFAEKLAIDTTDTRQAHPRLAELPFDSDRKMMSTVHEINGQKMLLVKGAPDVIISLSKRYLKNNQEHALDENSLEKLNAKIEEFSKEALRVLAFAYKPINTDQVTLDDETDFTFIGLLAMIDPPREEVFDAIKQAKSSGIKSIMITGDHKTTARAIAENIGLYEKGDLALTGAELDDLSEAELNEQLEKISVYARVSPENKIRIVRAWQNKGNISAMTGDGVNDAPALKQADIGIAMGTGTEVAKDAAAMVLTDDNFASIVRAIAVGRQVFDNIKKSVAYLFAGNLGAIIAIIFALVMDWNNPFTALQLLFINLVNDSVPAIALGTEKAEKNIMDRKPRDPNEGIFSGATLISVTYRGILIGLAVIIAQFIGMQQSIELGVAMSFSTLILARTLQIFPARSNSQTAISAGIFSNKAVVYAVLFCSLLYTFTLLPFVRDIFSIPAMFGMNEFLISFGLAIGAIILMELSKLIIIAVLKKK
ncbi:cation-transporting ATPase [Enterococcus sp. 5H]|nr:cation-transporting ATPase [Enterococcus sp. 5H]